MKLFFIIISVQECFATKLSLRIHGGLDAKLEEYPYVVRIEKQTSFNFTNNTVIVHHQQVCTASALSPVWVLTAAHCLKKANPTTLSRPQYTLIKMVIRYGNVANSPWVEHSFSEVLYAIMHPLHMVMKIGNLVKKSRNDIGLLKTSQINIGFYMKISAVDYKTMYGHEAIMGGFGITTKADAEGNFEINSSLYLEKPLQLLKVMVSKCSSQLKLVPGLCLTSKCGDVGNSCPGDSGGPVFHPSGLIGILSLGQSRCLFRGRVNTAAFITPITPYIEWIYSHVNA